MVKYRPARSAIEKITESIPKGPLGAIGEGNIIGGLGYLAVESGEVITLPIPGLKRPGFRVISHSLDEVRNGDQIHTVKIHAVSKDVAEFATEYESSPSNLDFIRNKTEVLSVEELDEDSIYTTYEIKVKIDRDAIQEAIE